MVKKQEKKTSSYGNNALATKDCLSPGKIFASLLAGERRGKQEDLGAWTCKGAAPV
jgi:hypothetical protein